MGSEYPINWSEEAIRNLESILDYLGLAEKQQFQG